MNGVNRVILVGNLGKDPDVKSLENGTKVAKFTMATNERYTARSGEKMTKTEWHNIILWRGLAENAERFLKKGSLIYLEGKLKSNSYTDKEGISRNVTEIEAENFTLLNRMDHEGNPVAHAEATVAHEGQATYNGNDPEGDLPF